MKATKSILQYAKWTMDYGMFYDVMQRNNGFYIVCFMMLQMVSKFCGFNASDWGEDIDDVKSNSGSVFFIGTDVFAWSLKKQSIVTLSTCEVDYVAIVYCDS